MRVLDLFSGIGGFSMGLETAGMETVAFCEIDQFCRRVLKKHWTDVPIFEDIKDLTKETLEGEGLLNEPIDLICGGFPCQPHSLAGKRKASEDDRDLWGEFARIIGEVKPRWVLAENVPGLLSSENGRFFGRVLRDLAGFGYDAEWHSIPARDLLGSPDVRKRIYIIAHHRSNGIQRGIAQEIQGFQAFPWCENVRGIEDLRDRPDLPPSLVWGNRNGIPNYMDRVRSIGNAVKPPMIFVLGNAIKLADKCSIKEW